MADQVLLKILVATPFDSHGVQALERIAVVDVRIGLTSDELESIIGEYHALIVGSETIVSGRMIEYAYHLQVIGVAGSSLDHINVSAARAQGVTIINVPNPRSLALAEQTISLVLRLAHEHALGGLSGKTLGIIGFGAVGHEVARRAKSFGMRILVNQPRLTPELALEAGIESCDFRNLLSEADFVSLHLPSTIETQHLIAESELAICRQECILINASQPSIVDIKDMDVALEKVSQYLLSRQPGNPLSLKVVDVDRVIFHEHFDPERVTDLAERLESAGTLVNPPVVVEWEDHYIVLDGATRTNAFKQLAYPHIVIQIVPADDERLLLHTWYHVLCAVSQRDLLKQLQGFKSYELKPEGDTTGIGFDQSERIISRLRLTNREKYLVEAILGVNKLVAMNEFVADYTEICRIERTLNTDVKELKSDYIDMAALVMFPLFTVNDVLQLAIKGQLLPAGITRFVIPGRVLRLHADLKRLKKDDPLRYKNAWLDRLLAEKMARRRIRYYQEPVFLLDE